MIGGSVLPGFEEVRAEFEENFTRRRELGAACAAYHRGVKVVDLWGGRRSARSSDPWLEDTLVLVYSTSRGLAAMALALAHSNDCAICRVVEVGRPAQLRVAEGAGRQGPRAREPSE